MAIANRNYFSLFEMDAVLHHAGAERVDEKASIKLREKLEDMGIEVVTRPKILARHAGRREVTRQDILLAATQVMS